MIAFSALLDAGAQRFHKYPQRQAARNAEGGVRQKKHIANSDMQGCVQ
jgi:hypothetical protein